jgi:hypothetical protein
MKAIIEVADYYNANVTVRLRAEVIKLDDVEALRNRATHLATLTAGQLAKLKSHLSNGPRGVNITKPETLTGKGIEGEIYVTL